MLYAKTLGLSWPRLLICLKCGISVGIQAVGLPSVESKNPSVGMRLKKLRNDQPRAGVILSPGSDRTAMPPLHLQPHRPED
jgi:hypothetical protein